MRIEVPHNTTRAAARARVESRLGELLGQFGSHAADASHEWVGDTLYFKGRARGFDISGSVEVTDTELIIDGKLPLMAMPFESKIRQTVEREAGKMFQRA